MPEMSTVPNFSVIKPFLKLCHNVPKCVEIKCISLTFNDRYKVLQGIRGIPIGSSLDVTP